MRRRTGWGGRWPDLSSVQVQVGEYAVQVWRGEPPITLDSLLEGAELSDTFGPLQNHNEDSEFFAVSISENGAGSLASLLMVAQRFSPSVPGFEPGVLIIPETGLVFVGAGERLLAYDLCKAARLWEDRAEVGFWWWDRAGDVVLMAAELELAAWDTVGHKLWTTFVEPPWFYFVDGETLHLNVMDSERSFSIRTGPDFPDVSGETQPV